MTRDEAIAEVELMRAADPGAGWIASERDGDWVVVRIGVAPTKETGTATRPPPVAPQGDPHPRSSVPLGSLAAGAKMACLRVLPTVGGSIGLSGRTVPPMGGTVRSSAQGASFTAK